MQCQPSSHSQSSAPPQIFSHWSVCALHCWQLGQVTSVCVAHGANDPRVPVGETAQLVAAVRGADHDVWYMLARNEGHGFRRKENRDLFMELTVLFLEQHLRSASR